MADKISLVAILSAQAAGFVKGMKTATSSLKDFSTEIKGGFAFGVMAKAGSSAFSAISGSVSGLAKEAVETSDAMQKLQQAMKFSGDYSDKEIEKIAGLNGTLKKYADETVFDLNDVMSTFGALSANGIKDADNLTKSVGNAVAVFGGGAQEYSSVALAFSQAMASGKLQAEDWNQILNASPQLAGGLRKELMKLNPKLKKDFKGAMADGAISADLLGKAMNNIGMTKMAKEAATSVTTFEGAMGNLEATVSGGLLTLYDSFAKAGLISAINTLNGKLEEGFDWVANNISKAQRILSPYILNLKLFAADVGKAFGEAFSAVGSAMGSIFSELSSTDAQLSFIDTMRGITGALKAFAGFIKKHADTIAAIAPKLVKLKMAYKGFKLVKTLVPGVKAFSGAIVKMAGKGIGAIAGKLFGIAAGEEATGAASSASAKQVLASAVAFIALGAGVALAGVGLAVIAQAAIALANQGALAVGVMGGLVVALAGLAFGASIIGPALTAGAVGFVAFGAAMVLVGAGMALAAGFIRNLVPLVKQVGDTAAQMAGAFVKAKAAGNAIGKGVLTSIRQGMNPLPKIAAQAMNSLVSAIKSGGSRATASARSAASSIVSALRHAVPGATSAGRYIGMGLANGMASQLGRVRSEAAQLASAAERAIRAKARIHSPSKVSQALGEYWGTGYALGISSMVQSTRKAAERLVTVPTLAAGPDLSYHGSLEQDFDYYRNVQYTIQVPVTVDGREFARATATYTQEELNKRQTRDSRKRGIL